MKNINDCVLQTKIWDDVRYNCKLCGFISERSWNSSEYKMLSHAKQIIKHLKNKHKIYFHEYDLKYLCCEEEEIVTKPWEDPESLFCDTDFLKNEMGVNVRLGDECKDDNKTNSKTLVI